jgi:hypothetical protein
MSGNPNPASFLKTTAVSISTKGGDSGGFTFEVADPLNPNETTGPPLPIPLTIINRLTLREKYDLKRYGLCFYTNVVHKEKIKWYATRWFRALMWVVAVIFAIFQYYGMLISMIASQVASTIDNPYLALAVVVIGTVLGGMSGGTSWSNMNLAQQFTVITKLTQEVSNTYFKVQYQKVQDEIEGINEETQAMKEKLDDMWHSVLMVPMDTFDMLYYTMYELPYEQGDKMFDTDAMLKLPRTLP